MSTTSEEWYEGIVRLPARDASRGRVTRGIYVLAVTSREAWVRCQAEVDRLRAGELIAVRSVRSSLDKLSDDLSTHNLSTLCRCARCESIRGVSG